jgi:hypothetical protein
VEEPDGPLADGNRDHRDRGPQVVREDQAVESELLASRPVMIADEKAAGEVASSRG